VKFGGAGGIEFLTVSGLAKVAIFTPNVDTENQILIRSYLKPLSRVWAASSNPNVIKLREKSYSPAII
jgi:hypothetical protein